MCFIAQMCAKSWEARSCCRSGRDKCLMQRPLLTERASRTIQQLLVVECFAILERHEALWTHLSATYTWMVAQPYHQSIVLYVSSEIVKPELWQPLSQHLGPV